MTSSSTAKKLHCVQVSCTNLEVLGAIGERLFEVFLQNASQTIDVVPLQKPQQLASVPDVELALELVLRSTSFLQHLDLRIVAERLSKKELVT